MDLPAGGMDLANLAAKDVIEYELKHPDGTPLGIFFELAGPSHPIVVEWEREALGEAVLRSQNGNRKQSSNPQTVGLRTEKASIDRVIAHLVGWRNVHKDGQSVPFSAAAAREILGDPKFAWIRLQLLERVGNTETFIVPSLSN